MGQGCEQAFLQRRYTMDNKHRTRRAAPFAIRKVPIGTARRHPLTPKVATIEKVR